MQYQLHHGDCLAVLAEMPDSSVDSIVTDPPYELGFMGKSWDASGIAYNVDMWREALRVLKPGGHLLAFSGSRTYHRMTCAIEDAGFEVRDQIMWVYGSGFPKSLDVSKAIDKANGRGLQDWYELGRHIRACRLAKGLTVKAVNAHFGGTALCNHWEAQNQNNAIPPTPEHWALLKEWLGCDSRFDEIVDRAGAEREVIGQQTKARSTSGASALPTVGGETEYRTWDLTATATDAARQWEGWGTALKPAHEPICVARKPLVGTVAANVLEFGTGALNIDGCRVGTEKATGWGGGGSALYEGRLSREGGEARLQDAGRWPANLIHDGSDEVVALFPDAKGQQGRSSDSQRTRANTYGELSDNGKEYEPRGDSGSAARFFYCAKASKSDRNSGLDSYVYVDIQWSFTKSGELTWEAEAQKVRLLVDTAPSQPRVTGVYGASNKSATEWNTMLFGSESTDPSQTDTMSTTKTKTSCTTISKILSCFQSFTTNESTLDVNCAMACGGSHAENAETGTLQMTTTDEWMALALGAEPAASPMRLQISVSAAQSGHPTVKPTNLMAYLVRLVTSPGGVVLDPFMGSGSTGKAAMREGLRFVGIDMTAEYVEIARARIEHSLFGDIL